MCYTTIAISIHLNTFCDIAIQDIDGTRRTKERVAVEMASSRMRTKGKGRCRDGPVRGRYIYRDEPVQE